MNSHNTFDEPETVKPAAFNGFALTDNKLTIQMPSKSIVVFEIQ
jgi:alpha-N-arabinofuranosidase